MVDSRDKARAALSGDRRVLAELAARLVRPRRDNLVERPWGGRWMEGFKSVSGDSPAMRESTAAVPSGRGGMPWGEAFEISAFQSDAEAARFPSRILLDDGSELALPELLEAHGEQLLGSEFVARHGACFPLLPKTLDVKELLSVQGHPPGNTEVYIIIDAEPGATLRLGFREDIDAAALGRRLTRGLEQQRELLALLGADIEATRLQALIAPWFAARDADVAALGAALETIAGASAAGATAIALLEELKSLYWHMLDSMNAIEVSPGQVIYNATPERLLGTAIPEPSAEVHALGNPEGREILALEIRRPGPTFRAWDNVRFPLRDVNVGAALAALNLRATRPGEFLRPRVPVAGREGVAVSVDSEYFRVEHLTPEPGRSVAVPAAAPHTLHCLDGIVDVFNAAGDHVGRLERGDSALVPIGVGAYRVESEAPADVVCVTLPPA